MAVKIFLPLLRFFEKICVRVLLLFFFFKRVLILLSYSAQDMLKFGLKCNSPLTAHNWQKWKRVFVTCPCHKIYRVKAVGLKSSNHTWKIMIFANMWNLGQFCEKMIFCQIKILFPNFVSFTVKSPGITQRSVSQENAFKKSYNLSPIFCNTIDSNNYFTLIKNKFRVLR